jgi:hypothetical protein
VAENILHGKKTGDWSLTRDQAPVF